MHIKNIIFKGSLVFLQAKLIGVLKSHFSFPRQCRWTQLPTLYVTETHRSGRRGVTASTATIVSLGCDLIDQPESKAPSTRSIFHQTQTRTFVKLI